ncbi:hypothetical protein TBLA_0H01420 [Henningerozyma blattae CBS 6284]|uniref:V-SNARE coiled-coil homology domain-containing protein n=1 Tax=Henningerozyma blattae (strain ATCC 34711 / CBS 6284 / DSM 70876 / NBRC 10599 / NRRL Y-10934 / UCD 77-7) TaxID=1071380 RepID=I2H7S7_HENB6|nr:hypothetical protein TBLA_0H01420 [Tetrapisispora blattae CBS 6284]CCH62429.1 hypothetical protein TBLA_0H01420 [Tetrapisispora blattae CBS 6284]
MKRFNVSYVEVTKNNETLAAYFHQFGKDDLLNPQSYSSISSNIVSSKVFHKLIMEFVLTKVVPTQGNKVTKVSLDMIDGFDCYYTTSNKGLVYICFTRLDVPKILPIRLLCDLKNGDEYDAALDNTTDSKLNDNIESILNEFHSELLSIRDENNQNNTSSHQTAKNAEEDLQQIITIMNDNIDKFLQRQERISLLVDKTSKLNNSSNVFKQRANKVKRQMWYNKFKSWASLLLIVTILVFVIGIFLYKS